MSITIGVDVSKKKLDIYAEGKHFTIENSEQSIQNFFLPYKKAGNVIFEATGKYHRLLHKTLESMDILSMVINPFQSRYFAKSMNIKCKTDKVDAKILCEYGEKIGFKKTDTLVQIQAEIQELSRHLIDLQGTRTMTSLRMKEAETEFIIDSCTQIIEALDEQIKATESLLKKKIEQDDELKKNVELLETIPGVGKKTAIMLVSFVRELGKFGRSEIAALTGLAPMNHDSGIMRGKRSIQGGRRDVRSQLYMPIMGASTMHNPRLKEFYNRLVTKGKAKKVALVACMRKLIVWANSILKYQVAWHENYVVKT